MEYNKLTERAQAVILEAENESEKFKHGMLELSIYYLEY